MFDRFSRAVEIPMGLFAAAIIPVIVLETHATSPSLQNAALWANWIIWIAFCVDYGVKFWLAPSRLSFIRSAWLDLAVIVVSPPFFGGAFNQGTRSLRLLRLLRVARAVTLFGLIVRRLTQGLVRRKFHLVLLTAIAATLGGALGVWVFERDINPNIDSLGSALWWAVVTETTVGYGDVSPVSAEGRVLAVLLMLVGIGVIGAFTACRLPGPGWSTCHACGARRDRTRGAWGAGRHWPAT